MGYSIRQNKSTWVPGLVMVTAEATGEGETIDEAIEALDTSVRMMRSQYPPKPAPIVEPEPTFTIRVEIAEVTETDLQKPVVVKVGDRVGRVTIKPALVEVVKKTKVPYRVEMDGWCPTSEEASERLSGMMRPFTDGR